jgi:hypothetical protein
MLNHCKSKKQNGQPCGARPVAGSEFCYFHDPTSSPSRREAQSRGGRAKPPRLQIRPLPPFELDLRDPSKIREMLTYAANRLIRREMDPKEVHALAHLVQCALQAYDVGDLQKKLAQLERLQNTESGIPSIDDEESFLFEEHPSISSEISSPEDLANAENQIKSDAA